MLIRQERIYLGKADFLCTRHDGLFHLKKHFDVFQERRTCFRKKTYVFFQERFIKKEIALYRTGSRLTNKKREAENVRHKAVSLYRSYLLLGPVARRISFIELSGLRRHRRSSGQGGYGRFHQTSSGRCR